MKTNGTTRFVGLLIQKGSIGATIEEVIDIVGDGYARVASYFNRNQSTFKIVRSNNVYTLVLVGKVRQFNPNKPPKKLKRLRFGKK